jgi:hypothetical protein
MRRTGAPGAFAALMLAVSAAGAWTQEPAAAPPAAAASTPPAADAQVGGALHGVVKSGNIPLPGVTVTAQNTLTGKRYSTTTDITGAWAMTIPQNGRYVIRTQFAAFAQGSQEALLNATGHDRTVNFELMLASRAAAAEQQQARQAGQQGQAGEQDAAEQAIRQLAGNGAESLSLTSALTDGTDTGSGTAGTGGADLPSIASNSDFSSDSVAISGQTGQVSAIAGQNIDQLRDQLEAYRQQNGGQAPGTGGLFGGFGGGGFGGGGFGGGGFGGGGFGGGGRGNFRGFNPAQPHGAVAWNGTNSIFNAQPFALLSQQQNQPSNGSNRFTLTFMTAPYIPHLTKPSGKDTVFLTLSGTRQSTPLDDYATLPTAAERTGDFSASGLPAIYDPATLQQFVGTDGTPNVIPLARFQNLPSYALLNCATSGCQPLIPLPNVAANGLGENYHLLTTQQSNSTRAGIRYNRALGANTTPPGRGGRGGFGGGRGGRNQNQGLRQSINFNFNWSQSAADEVNFIPDLGGKTASNSYSLQAGHNLSYHRFTSIFNANWNRSNSRSTNFFTNTANNIASTYGITVPNGANALNYGLPDIQLSEFTGISEQQPSFAISQTLAFSEVVSWIHGKHNMRFGTDYRRVHRDFLAGSDATGVFAFTGLFTEDAAQDQDTGSAVADFLLGLPQSTNLNSSLSKSYLRDNVYDAYAMDDWRMRPSLTLNYGVRWEFYAPYTEKYGHLADVYTNPGDAFSTETEAQAGTNGLPGSLVYPWRRGFRPSVGLAWRVPKLKQTVVRAGFGMNYTVGEYATFANKMAHQPFTTAGGQSFNNVQINQEQLSNKPSSACARGVGAPCFTLGNGFQANGQALGSYAVDPHYPLPYVMAWNLDIQRRLPLGIVLNVGYNGSRGNHLDTVIEPRAIAASPLTNPTNLNFSYEEAQSFSKFNAATVRVNKQLQKGISLGANYQYSHSIDDAGALGAVGGVGVQDWQNVLGELGNSGLDVRRTVSGTYLYELPFGSDKTWVTTGAGSHILEGISVSGSFKFASGTWLSPSYSSSVLSTSCGTGGVFRPNLVAGQPVTAGGGSLHQWFNPNAYALPPEASDPTNPYPCGVFGTAPRNSIEGPGTVSNNMSLSKTVDMGDTRNLEIRATIDNVFNTVQYAGVGTTKNSPTFGEVTSVGAMRSFQFMARFRF